MSAGRFRTSHEYMMTKAPTPNRLEHLQPLQVGIESQHEMQLSTLLKRKHRIPCLIRIRRFRETQNGLRAHLFGEMEGAVG